MCTKKSGLNASGHRDALSNDRRESAAHFKRPAKQALALAIEPRAKREARSVLCHTCQESNSNVRAERERRHCRSQARAIACYEGCGLCNRFNLRMRTVLFDQVYNNTTVNREYFVSKIFHAINFHVKQFSDKRPCTALSFILRMYFFVHLIFAQARLSENIITTKYSQFTVLDFVHELCLCFVSM